MFTSNTIYVCYLDVAKANPLVQNRCSCLRAATRMWKRKREEHKMFKAGFFLHWTVAVGCDSSDLFQPTLFIHTDHQTIWWPGACMPSLILCHGVARLCGLTTEVTSCQNFISHYCILTRGVCLAFSKNEWHIKTCCNLTTQKKRHKTTSQEVLVEVSLRFNECRQKLLHHKDKKINIRLQHNWVTCSFTTMIKTAQVHYGNFLGLVSKFACFGTFFLFQAILWGKCKGKQSVTKWTHTHISPPTAGGFSTVTF